MYRVLVVNIHALVKIEALLIPNRIIFLSGYVNCILTFFT